MKQFPWGTQPGTHKNVRKSSVALQVLKGIALTGMVLVAASNPYFGINALRALKKDFDRKQWRKLNQSIRYLKSRGYVQIISNSEKGMQVKITRSGKSVVKYVDIATIRLEKPQMWDKKWRVVIFDIPNYKSKNRNAFREKIKELGFRLVQKSVWIYPYECREQLMILRKFYDIEKYVTYLETTDSEDEDMWLSIFRMQNT